MKKIILSFLAFAAVVSTCLGQPEKIAGKWLGAIQPQLRIVFHLKVDNGKLSATLDSPDQGATGIACSSANIKDDSLLISIDVAKANFRGKIISDTMITGMWLQGPASFPLTLKRTDQIKGPNRPQTPLPPFSYNTDSVEYDNADKSVHLGATFSYPKGKGPFAAVVLISGSGQQDRDETIFSHKPFAVLADYLTKNGIAILRVDDRAVGKSTGEVATATSADFANDVEASISYLLQRPEVDKNKIGLLGHSEGGMIAPMVAARNKNVDFVIMWGAPMAGGLEINVDQNGYALAKAGIQPSAINAFKQLHRKELQHLAVAKDTADLRPKVLATFENWRKQQPDSVLKSLYVTDQMIVGQKVVEIYMSLYNQPWMRYFITNQPAADLSKVTCKVLAINGSLDTQVDAAENLSAIKNVLQKNGNKNFTILELKGLNHLLQSATTGDFKEYGQIEETIAPSALATIGNWINENVINSKK